MKVEFELTVNKKCEPIIRVKHYDRKTNLEQKLLGIFIQMAKERGIEIVNPNGMIEAGTDNSWEQYLIKIK